MFWPASSVHGFEVGAKGQVLRGILGPKIFREVGVP